MVLISQRAVDAANEIIYDQNGRSDLFMDMYYFGSVVLIDEICNTIKKDMVLGVDYKELELKVYWIPNPPHEGFEFKVSSMKEAKDAYNILSYLDLGLEYKANTYGTDAFRQRFINAYKAYRRGRGINHPSLIELNVGGLLYKTADGEFEEYTNEWGEDIYGIMRNEEEENI